VGLVSGAVTLATLPVAEVFGPTIQGEGPAAGRCATFVRLSGCNLSCRWCDTPYTWDAARFDVRGETEHLTAAEIVHRVYDAGAAPVVVLTGGEPLLQQDRPAWARLLAALSAARAVHLETNGTIVPNGFTLAAMASVVVSPKLDHAGPHRGHQEPAMPPAWRDVIRDSSAVHLKIVCRDAADVAAAATLARDLGCPPERTWAMPEGDSTATLGARWRGIAEAAAAVGINATHRLHTLAWGAERGR
jgi:7-carboxy-7-deazaguanine synthase